MISSADQWKKFSALVPVGALAFLDQTILPVALPTIQREMNASSTSLQWSVNAYLLAVAIFVLVSGKIGDRFGHKKTLLCGMLIFVAASILCGLSPNVWFLIGARFLQGMGAAMMFPAQTTMIAHIFPAEKRGRAVGMIVSIGSLFLILGPFVGGYLIEAASWHWIFWINLPIGLLGLWLIYLFLPETSASSMKIDLLGFGFFALAISALTLVFMQAVEWGWSSNSTIICIILAGIFLSLLLYREKKTPHPFLDLSLFKHPVFSAINISIFTIQFLMMITVFRTIYFQEVLGYSPFETGIIMFMTSVPVLVIAPIAGYLSDHISPKLPIALGYLLLIFSNFLLAFSNTPSLLVLSIALIAFGMGIPFIFTPSFSSALAAVPKEKTGVASGMIVTLRMTGGTIGLALIYLFVASVQKSHEPLEGKDLAQITSFSYVHFALAFLLIVAFAIAFIFHSRKSSHHLPPAPAEGWD